jgi:hypothetical protein
MILHHFLKESDWISRETKINKQRSRLGSKQEGTGDGDGNNEDGAAWSAGLPLCFLHFHLHLASLLSVRIVSVAFYCEISMTQEVKTTSHKRHLFQEF